MNAEELDPNNVTHDASEGNLNCVEILVLKRFVLADPLVIEHGTFSWGEDPILRDINVRVPPKSLVAIVGPVGAGKSSLISAFLGEMDKLSGRVNFI